MGENKIILTPIQLRYQKPTEIKECFIELFQDYLHYKMEMIAEEPIIENDDKSGWEPIHNKYEWIVLKKNVAGLEKSLTKDKKWAVYIIINGFQNDLKVYYRTEQPAQQLFDRLQEWLLK